MTLLRHLADLVLGIGDDTEAPPAAPPPGTARLYVFHGTFETEEQALAYCYDAPDPAHPEPLTRDLPGAYIDTTYVDVLWGKTNDPALRAYFPDPIRDQIIAATEASNTVVLISQDAFGGFGFRLNDTPHLTYLGHWDVVRS